MTIEKSVQKGRKLMFVLLLIAVAVSLVIIYLSIPYSPLKSDFENEVSNLIASEKIAAELFTEEDISGLPTPVQKYFTVCGYIGTPKMSYMKAVYHDVDFLMSTDKPYSRINYTQYNFVKEPMRTAFIETSMYGIPFQGLDSYIGGKGGMKGVIAKAITLFNEMGSEMDKACLVTVLSECLLVPNIALQDYITWESIDDTHAKGTITYYGISGSGIFTFAESGEMLSFITNDRWEVGTDGEKAKIPWSAVLGDYKESSGIKQPTKIKAVWHYEDGDSVYFDSHNFVIEYH